MKTFREWIGDLPAEYFIDLDPSVIDHMLRAWTGAMESMIAATSDQPRYIFEDTPENHKVALMLSDTKPGEMIPLSKEQMKIAAEIMANKI